MITSKLDDTELEMIIKMWFRKNKILRIRHREYTYQQFMKCLTNNFITNETKDSLMNTFSSVMNEGGDSFGVFPVEVITDRS